MSVIPKNLDEAFAELMTMIDPEEMDKFDAIESAEGVIIFHNGFGRWMRNNWGLWKGSELKDHMKELGCIHPDDMSNEILKRFWEYRQQQKTLENEK